MSQEFDNNVSDIVTQKGFYSYDYISNFEKFKEELREKWQRYRTSKQPKRLFKVYIKTKLYVAQNIWQ